MAPPKRNLYEVLGVPPDAEPEAIGLARKMRLKELQRGVPHDPSAVSMVQQAFEILSNPAQRATYDAKLLAATERAAAEQQGGALDLEFGEDEVPARKLPLVPIAVGALVVIAVLFFALRSPTPEAPEPVAQPVAPAAPEPPRERTSSELLAQASASAGALMAYSMSGSATAIGLALAIDTGTMITTCHAIPAGGKLVVRVRREQHPADLTITDESLDLCRLSVGGVTAPALMLAADVPKAGDKIYAVVLDASGALAVLEGTVKALRKAASGTLLELTTPIAPNSSGAGVFDSYGKLVGVATASHGQGTGVHIAIPATAIAQMRSRTK